MNIKIKSTNSLKWGKSDVEKEKCSHLKNFKFHTAIPLKEMHVKTKGSHAQISRSGLC